ncbi:MAG: hypothetical protein M3198_19475, partial [Actinomycetota bacterium]|nr:hypothetical protein [Actinomycetota bacterium]
VVEVERFQTREDSIGAKAPSSEYRIGTKMCASSQQLNVVRGSTFLREEKRDRTNLGFADEVIEHLDRNPAVTGECDP